MPLKFIFRNINIDLKQLEAVLLDYLLQVASDGA